MNSRQDRGKRLAARGVGLVEKAQAMGASHDRPDYQRDQGRDDRGSEDGQDWVVAPRRSGSWKGIVRIKQSHSSSPSFACR